MLALTSVQVNFSFFNLIEGKDKFDLYTDTFDKFSFEELKDELEQTLIFSDITPYHLKHEQIGPRFIKAYEK